MAKDPGDGPTPAWRRTIATPALLAAAAAWIASCSTYHGVGRGVEFGQPQPDAEGDGRALAAKPDFTFDLSIEPLLSSINRRPSAPPSRFDWPVDEARVSRGFKVSRRSHWGLDLANRKGTKVLAADDGQVVYVGREFHGYGKLVVIEHADEWATLYAHLDKFLVKEGDVVRQGEPIGLMGRTGHATGVHLHFEMRRNRMPVNPMLYLPAGF